MTVDPVIVAQLHLAGTASADEVRVVTIAPGVVTTSATVQRQGPPAEGLPPLVVVDGNGGGGR